MALAGFRAVNDQGVTQIGSYQQHSLVYSGIKGSISTGSPTVYGRGSEVSVDLPLASPLMAVGAQNGAILALVRAQRLSASAWRLFYICSGPPGTVMDYYGFGVSRDVTPPSRTGLTIYNADGSLAYSSNISGAKIAHATMGSLVSYDLPADRTYAAINGTVVREETRTGDLIAVDDRTGRETWSVQRTSSIFGTYINSPLGNGFKRVGTNRIITSTSSGTASSDPYYQYGPTQSCSLFVDVTDY